METKSHKGSAIFFCITTLILSILVTVFYTKYNKTNDSYVDTSEQMKYEISVKEEYSSRVNALQQEYTDTVEAANFYNEKAVICTDEDNTYHKYGCSFLTYSSFYIYNIENAEHMGYKPCQYCCKDEYRDYVNKSIEF